MRLLLFLLAATFGFAQDAPRLLFSKSFPGSRPAYYEVRLERNGSAEYREDPRDDNPVLFKLRPDETTTVFLLSEKLDKCKRQLESGLKVARMGEKTFRCEQGSEKNETKFNYTTDLDGQTLLDWFERMAESATLYIELERSVKFDRLGVNQSILKVEAAWDRKRLIAPEQYIPLLNRVVKNDGYLNMARDRAARLVEVFSLPPTAGAGEAKAQ
jgi:hypothetical protein